jgi:farnesyl diphosphate synthase
MPAALDQASVVPNELLLFQQQLDVWREHVDRALMRRLPAAHVSPRRLHEAMRYSVLGSGKRVRPALVFATARTLGLDEETVEAAACAVEMIHAYSLVHDDLPAMDDDDLRRGRPTCHKAFDEATAILAGDALQPLAFQLLACEASLPAQVRIDLIALLAEASGSLGMAGGQALDVAVLERPLDLAALENLHSLKTGALIRACVLMAAACARGLPAASYAALEEYAASVGLAFQIQDDLLDVIGDAAVLGKPTGADAASGKSTFPALLGIDGSRERVSRLHAQALHALECFGTRATPLRLLSHWLLERRK